MRLSRAAYYKRNLDRERESARQRSQKRSQRLRESAKDQAQSIPVVATLTLTATEKVLGGALCIDSRVRWSALEAALRKDLRAWHERDDGNEHAAYEAFVKTLISCKKPSRRLATLQAKVRAKIDFVNTVAKVAREADGELMRRNPRGYHSRFLNLQREAYKVDTCLDEMLMYHREGHECLETAFNAKRLFWHDM
ncbi:hypothetical protein EXIGLDRAFT_765406 [Exidia glandulosa HHB12029]|uniref:Uncharacterized protein n=1 Tax=Exidia glandulosa HHB12029 TaxID=1314781 RepID=A0A165KGK2_EXIGL|nr:hypothetical protein EXIGLDRAFT_765406 [Exidia glandulosa HHB12029]